MIFQGKAQWREGFKDLIEGESEPPVFDDYRSDAFCSHGIVIRYKFVDEEHGERDAAQAVEVVGETDEAACRCAYFVDEEGEEQVV